MNRTHFVHTHIRNTCMKYCMLHCAFNVDHNKKHDQHKYGHNNIRSYFMMSDFNRHDSKLKYILQVSYRLFQWSHSIEIFFLY